LSRAAASGLEDGWSAGRWLAAGVVALAAHGLLAAAAVNWQVEPMPPAAPPPAMMMDLAPLPAAPPLEEAKQPPAPEIVQAAPPPPPDAVQPPKPDLVRPPEVARPPEPELVKLAEVPPESEPEPELAKLEEPPPLVQPTVALPRPKPRPKPARHQPPPPQVEAKRPPEPTPQPPAPTNAAPPTAPVAPAKVAAAPQQSAPVPVPANVMPTFQQRLLAHLERHKRYPRDAQWRRQQGVVYLRFVMDRSGNVLSARLERGSGYPLLDGEVQALIHRAEPLPAMPPELHAESLELIVPVQFYLR